MAQCIFCKMIQGEVPVPKVYEDESFICIRDIHPQAKTHLLVIPKEHIPSLIEAFPDHKKEGSLELMGGLLQTAVKIARQEGLLSGGFRSVLNSGVNAGQTVFHLHLHLLGGESLNSEFA